MTELELLLNVPPIPGNCTVEPRDIDLGESVTIDCFGWSDSDGIQSYKYNGMTSV